MDVLEIAFSLLAFVPIVIAGGLFLRRIGAVDSMPPVCVVTSLIALFAWRVAWPQVFASVLQGLWLFYHVAIITFGALVLARMLDLGGVFRAIRLDFEKISPDRRIQAIFVAWFFGSALESVMGFAAARAMTAIILTGIGFPPASAGMIAIMGPMTASAFCVMGTPLVYGVYNGLQDPIWLAQLAFEGVNMSDYLRLITIRVATLHGIVGIFQPLFMVMMLTRFTSLTRSWTEGLSLAPFALFCGAAFTIPYMLTAVFIGPEYPSLIGAGVGFLIAFSALRMRWLIPKDVWQFPPKHQWLTNWSAGRFTPDPPAFMPRWKSWGPLSVLVLLFLVTRVEFLPVRDWLQSVVIDLKNLFGSHIHLYSQPLYSPAVVLFLMAGLTALFFRFNIAQIRHGLEQTRESIIAIVIIGPFTAATAFLYTNSSVNGADSLGMTDSLTNGLSHLFGGLKSWILPLISPFIGTMGTYFATNNVAGNLAFANLQRSLGETAGLTGSLFVALQMVGASCAGMIAIHYIAWVGKFIKMPWEVSIARRTSIPMLVYLFLTGILGVLSANGFDIALILWSRFF